MTNHSIAGYRIVRILAETDRESILLAQPLALRQSRTELVVLRCFREGIPFVSVLNECEAMTCISSPHLAAVYDLASVGENTMIAVCEWIPGLTLSRLLKSREHLTAGEAITILAPLVDTIDCLHRAGIVLGGINADSVLFRESGSPVLTDFSRTSRLAPERSPAILARESGIQGDIASIVQLCLVVLSAVRIDATGQQRLMDCVDWLSSTTLAENSRWAIALEERLFGLCAPEPVRVVAESSSSSVSSLRIPRESGGYANGISEVTSVSSDTVSVLGFPSWLQIELARVIATARTQLQTARTRATGWLAPVRPRMWLLAGFAGVAVLTAVVISIVAPGESDDLSAAEPLSASSTAEPAQAVTSSDPEVAASELLLARERCFRDLSVECLRDVEQSESPAFTTDSNIIALVIEGGDFSDAALLRFDTLSIAQELGNSVVISLGVSTDDKPASLLLVKSEAGWRIRSYSLPSDSN